MYRKGPVEMFTRCTSRFTVRSIASTVCIDIQYVGQIWSKLKRQQHTYAGLDKGLDPEKMVTAGGARRTHLMFVLSWWNAARAPSSSPCIVEVCRSRQC